MRRALLLLFCILFTQFLFSQDTYLRWARQIAGGLSTNESAVIKVDSSGNVYTVGVFNGTVDLDPGPGVFSVTSNGGTDVFISKLDANGNFVWARQIGGPFDDNANSALTLDAAGNIYISGCFKGTVDFDPGSGVYNLTSTGKTDIYILKLDTNGNFTWVKQIGGAENDSGLCLSAGAGDNIYLTGYFGSTVDFDPGPGVASFASGPGNFDAFILKLTKDGNYTWAKCFSSSQVTIGFSVIEYQNNIYLAGDFFSTTDFDLGPGVYSVATNGASDAFIEKMDLNGNFIWVKTFGGNAFDDAYGIAIDATGDVYVAGDYMNTVDFDPGPGVNNISSYDNDGYVLKLDAAGNFLWVRSTKGNDINNFCTDIKLDRLGNVYTTGFFNGTTDFNSTGSSHIVHSNGIDIFIWKLDANGNYIWTKVMQGSGQDLGSRLYIDKYLNIYTVGYFGSTVDFDPETPVYNLTATTAANVFVQKLAQCASSSFSTLTAATCRPYMLNGYTYTASGVYTQTLFNAAGCDSIITINLTVANNAVRDTLRPSICFGQSYFAAGALQTVSGTYRDTLQTMAGCDSIIVTNLLVGAQLTPDLGLDRRLCTGTSIAPGTFASYKWQDNSTQAFYIIKAPGKYWVTVEDAGHCTAADTVLVTGIDTLPNNFLPADKELCSSSIKISVPGYNNYLWNTGISANTVNISRTGLYYVTVTDLNNCVGRDSINILRCTLSGIPNSFTPNGDNINDVFRPFINATLTRYSLFIYNRYGQKIFETADYLEGWNGTFEGKPQPAGNYVYLIQYTDNTGKQTKIPGSILLLR